MSTIPLLQKVLGEDWHKLPVVIQQHYITSTDSYTCVKGNMQIGYPDILLPLIRLIQLFGGLISVRGDNIMTEVQKTNSSGNTELLWLRRMTFADNSIGVFNSHMVYLHSHELIEFVRFGFGLRLLVSVENGDLIYRSNGHIWQWGKLLITFPDWLLLGSATIIERRVSDQQFSVDFTICHVLWGNSYWYRGVFHYCE